MLYNSLIILLALAMSLTFFGKAVIGITLGIAVIVSLVIIVKERCVLLSADGRLKSIFFSKEKLAVLIMLGVWLISAAQGIHLEKSIKEVAEYGGIILGGFLIFTAVSTQVFSFE